MLTVGDKFPGFHLNAVQGGLRLNAAAIEGGGMCVESHEKVVTHSGSTAEQVQAAVRIASVIHAVAARLDQEAALAA
jgi:alkyl hydroperoxide reductase subunit D